ncbi:MAG: DUF1493 family protein [Flavobacteriales bacterium]|nr:DUF1493 family protein [Flavobacteriales bacterium]
MGNIDEILIFIKEQTGIPNLSPDTDIHNKGVGGDDFFDLIESFAKEYEVDISEYLWYFHSDEEASPLFGGLFFKPPYMRAQRIPITPLILAEFAKTKKWHFDYPEHKLPKKRYDIIVNQIVITIVLAIIVGVWLYKILKH